MKFQANPEVQALLEELRGELQGLERGAVADYIPELAHADPQLFGLAICDLDGQVVGAGDADAVFTLQSVSKPFQYGLAMAQFGIESVHERVGVEPTGGAFDAIVQVDEHERRPHNPMVNAGAIAISGLLAGEHVGGSVDGMLARLGAFAGEASLPVDVPVYLSERASAHRNRAIAHLLRYFSILDQPVEQTLDLYFHQCSALVSVRQLALMAATLAAGGRNPRTGEQLLSPEVTGQVLAVLSTCGLYDASGRFLFDVGLPGKSGVSGGLFAVAPGRMGIAVFSPPLDEDGNSVRAAEALRRLSRRLALHAFDPAPAGSARRLSKAWPAATQDVLERARQAAASASGGRVADYAPALAQADPADFALAVCTVDGEEFVSGNSARRFTLQAAASPLGYAHVAREVGVDAIHERCGVEPSGNPFHAILFDPRTQRPFNPLGNAGAIVVTGLAPGSEGSTRLRSLLGFLADLAGGPAPAVDASMLAAEHAAGERNRAIAALLRGEGWLDDPEAALELYMQQCSVAVDVACLARMGATLANGGVQPTTGRTVVPPDVVRATLSLMYTCGHHEESGRVAAEVGLPAKSGISGAILAVCPGRLAIAAWSPAVNAHGTSVPALAALTALSHELHLGTFGA